MSTTTGSEPPTDSPAAVPAPTSRVAVVVYCLIAYGLAWFVCLPLWLGDGLSSPLFFPISIAMMLTPTVASLVVVRFVERRPIVRTLGLRPPDAGRTALWLGIALASVLVVVVLGLASSALLGTFRFDIGGMSAFRELLTTQLGATGRTPDELGVPLRVLWALQLVNVALASAINTLPALGEEIGWRGYLFPRLRDLLGPAPAVLVSGVIWGLWHAPLILLGYNYPGDPVLGTFAMCVPTIGLGALLAWVSQRGGSVWPAALGHGTFNAAVGSFLVMFGDADFDVDMLSGTVMGWGGWPVWVLVVAAILVVRGLRPYDGNGRSSAAPVVPLRPPPPPDIIA